MYQQTEDGQLHLVWNISINETNGENWWDMRVDAGTGEIMGQE